MNKSHFHYQVYGLRLCSGLPLEELPTADFEGRDVSFGLLPPNGSQRLFDPQAKLLTRRETNLGCDLSMYDTGDSYLLSWDEFCDYLVSKDGEHIQCQLRPSMDIEWVQNTLYSMILALTLQLRGVSNFHASCIQLPQGAVAFMADPGSGKSTMSATFAVADYPFLTDDILAVKPQGSEFMAYPGFPFISLSAQSMTNVIKSLSPNRPLPAEGDKERVGIKPLGLTFQTGPVPLQAMYLLERGDPATAIDIQRLTKEEAVLGLLKHTNCTPLLPLAVLRRHLDFVTQLIAALPVYRLRYPTDYQQTSQVIAAVLEQQHIAVSPLGAN